MKENCLVLQMPISNLNNMLYCNYAVVNGKSTFLYASSTCNLHVIYTSFTRNLCSGLILLSGLHYRVASSRRFVSVVAIDGGKTIGANPSTFALISTNIS